MGFVESQGASDCVLSALDTLLGGLSDFGGLFHLLLFGGHC